MMNDRVEPPQADPAAGLCATCRHVQRIESARGTRFYLCQRSRIDPAFPKYPRLPMVACRGYEPAPSA